MQKNAARYAQYRRKKLVGGMRLSVPNATSCSGEENVAPPRIARKEEKAAASAAPARGGCNGKKAAAKAERNIAPLPARARKSRA
jgi:hypothetical protein